MKKRIRRAVRRIKRIMSVVGSHHTGAYAAQSAYFFVLSLIPVILLLLTMVQFTPATYENVMYAVEQIFPTSVQEFISTLVRQVYEQSLTVIPVTILVAMWSAGRGVLAVTAGLNSVYERAETRNYIYLRLRATIYTVIFLLAIVLSLTLAVFGNSISVMIYRHVPVLIKVTDFIIKIRTIVTLAVLTVFWDTVYRFLPNRKGQRRTTMKKQLPGAVFTACGWLLISFVFSIYLDIFQGFKDMYGSMTTIVLLMLWLYLCMYVILLGGEVNVLWEKYGERK